MKTIKRIACILLLAALATLLFAGCEKAPGIYNWYGGKMNADYILDIKVDGGNGVKTYQVPFEEYRAVFLYLKGIVPSIVTDEDGNTVAITSDEEKTKAIKEVTEETLMDYYALIALGEKYGISITENDKDLYHEDYLAKLQAFVDKIDESEMDFDGTKEEYAEYLYRNSLALAGGMTPEYMEFTYYRDLLAKRIKLAISEDLGDYLNQSYFRYKQVMILYTKGDTVAEAQAKADISEVYARLANGEDIETLAKEYDNSGYSMEYYVDSYGNVVASSSNETVNDITLSAVKALDFGECSTVITGDDSDRAAYVAVFQRCEIQEDFACEKGAISGVLFESPYVGATTPTPYFSRYSMLVDSYRQNMVCTPVSEKVYDRIAVNTLF